MSENPVRSLEISYKDDATTQHFRRFKNFILSSIVRDPKKWDKKLDSFCFKSQTEGSELVLNSNQSSFYVGTASTKTGERGGTVQNLLFSEAAHFPDTGIISAKEIIEGSRNMVAVGAGKIFMESTANGINYFKKIWDQANRGLVDYKPRFFSWRDFYNDHDFNLICQGFSDKAMIKQEYPDNPTEAFLRSAERIVIPIDDILACQKFGLALPERVRRLTVCDVAGEGDDDTVIYDMHESKIVNQEIYRHVLPMDTVGRLQAHAFKNESTLICVDKIGEGSGVYGRLVEIYSGNPRMTIYGFDSRISPPEGLMKETYANYKTYAWYEIARKMFQERKVTIPDDYILVEELSAHTYTFRNGRMAIEAKDEIKDRLGHSPNRADAYIMGLEALNHVKFFKLMDGKEVGKRSFIPSWNK